MQKINELALNKGISLIALIITIVIILILAGIELASITKDNGTINQANEAKEKVVIAQEKESISQAAIFAIKDSKRGDMEKEKIEEQLNRIVKDDATEVTSVGENFSIKFVKTQRIYEIDKNGRIVRTSFEEIQMPKFSISYIDIKNNGYPTEIEKGETLKITFVKEIPLIVEVTGAKYTYNKPTITISNVKSDIIIKNPEKEVIAFEEPGPIIFSGNNYINTDTPLFSEENINRNFQISFEITEDNLSQAGYSTVLSALNESDSKYPGFLVRVGTNDYLNKYQITANNGKDGKAIYVERENTNKIEIYRNDGILYLRINEGTYERMLDYSSFTNYFDVPLTFGAAINSSGNPFRYFKGKISNIQVKFLGESIIIPTNESQ